MKWTMSREPTAKSIGHSIITRGGRGAGGFFSGGGGGEVSVQHVEAGPR